MKSFYGFILLFFFVSACAKPPQESNTLHLRLKQDISTLDPAFIVDLDGGKVAAKLFNGLVKYDQNLNIVGDLAISWKISKQGKLYTFHLKPNVTFSNGRQVTAEDVQYSFERIQNPSTLSPRKWTLDQVQSITTDGDRTVQIELKEPFSPFLSLLTLPSAYIIPKEEVERATPSFRRSPVGTGPFVLKEWKTSTQITLAKNPNYFDTPAQLSQIIYKIIPEDFVTVGEFERKLLDAIEIPRADFEHYTHSARFTGTILDQTGLNTYYLGFNCARPPFDSKLLRQAVNHAVNKQALAQKVMEGRCQIATAPVPPPLNPEQKQIEERYRYNPEKAKQLLEEAKLPSPLKINFFINQDKEVFSIATLIQEDLKKIGIEVNLVLRDWSAFKEAVNKGDADCFFLSWWADYPDIENFLFPTFHSKNFGAGGNRTFYKNPKVDALLNKGQKIIDPAERSALYAQAQNQILDDAPWVPLWHRKTFFVHHPHVRNLSLPPVYTMEKATDIAVD